MLQRILALACASLIFAADYDCIVIGTSPFSLFEALSHLRLGEKVLILEKAHECGGAWKSIDICNHSHVDAGCHFLDLTSEITSFLEKYGGCSLQNGYFSNGCFELIDFLHASFVKEGGTLLLDTEAYEVWFDSPLVFIQTSCGPFTTDKLIFTPQTRLTFPQAKNPKTLPDSQYYHLFLLLEDVAPPSFTYQLGGIEGVNRMMNLTQCNHVATPKQLIALQLHGSKRLDQGEFFFEKLKEHCFVSPDAKLLQVDSYVYREGRCHTKQAEELNACDHIEILQTGSIQSLSRYIPRWEKTLAPYPNLTYQGSQ